MTLLQSSTQRQTQTMATATQGYRSPELIEPNKAFFGGFGSIEKNNSNHMLRNCGKNANSMNVLGGILGQHVDTLQQQRTNEYSRIASGDDMATFFDFEPQTNPGSPFNPPFSTTTNPAMGSGWNNIPFETLSPPDSAILAPEEWPAYQFQSRQPQNIVPSMYPNDTRIQYGQTTPPDDDESSLFEYEHKQQQPTQPALASSVTGAKKRKRGSAASNEAALPPKRSRKSAARSSLAHSSNIAQADSNNPEDIRRSKFLERNRVAASKCRQKKKEWTSNLETRARDLQKNNSSLRLMLGSLKDEILFLKGECLKHTACGCEQIQSFLKQRGGDVSEQPEDQFKTEQSPIGSAPTSRHGSTSTGSDQGGNDGTSPPMVQDSPPSASPKDHVLEALLSAQFVHDTSEQGIAQQVEAAE